MKVLIIEEGLELSFINEYDLIILDLNLPSIDRLDILGKIRKEAEDIKIFIFSARSKFIDRIKGLDIGANDYLVKHYDFGKLVARVRALVRRSFTQSKSKIKGGNMIIDTSARVVYSDKNERLDLASNEFAIFEYLIANKGRSVSTEEVIEKYLGRRCSRFSNSIKDM